MNDLDPFTTLLGSGHFIARVKALIPDLKPRHIQLLHLLLKREFISNEGLLIVFEDVSLKSIHNWMHYIRKFTKAEITNTYGIGYSMKLEDRKRLIQLIGDLNDL